MISGMTSYLARPSHALPYTEIADYPCQQESERQLPADAARVVKTVGDPQSVTSENQQCHCSKYVAGNTPVLPTTRHVQYSKTGPASQKDSGLYRGSKLLC